MRFIKDIPNEYCKTSLYFFNNKYIIKFEAGLLEQVYKISEMDVTSEQEVTEMLHDAFYARIIHRFKEMAEDFQSLLQ